MSKNEVVAQKIPLSGYTRQVILNFDFSGGKIAAEQLKMKWDNNKKDPEKCTMINVSSPHELSLINQKFSALSELDSNSRLYIIIHSMETGSLLIGRDSFNTQYYYSQLSLVNFLKNYLKADENIKISLIVCNMAKPRIKKDFFTSPASELHLKLYNHGLNTTILAITTIMRTVMDTKKIT